jgi:hypothetical protein
VGESFLRVAVTKPLAKWPVAIVWLLVFMGIAYTWIAYVLIDCRDNQTELAECFDGQER